MLEVDQQWWDNKHILHPNVLFYFSILLFPIWFFLASFTFKLNGRIGGVIPMWSCALGCSNCSQPHRRSSLILWAWISKCTKALFTEFFHFVFSKETYADIAQMVKKDGCALCIRKFMKTAKFKPKYIRKRSEEVAMEVEKIWIK